MGWTDERVSLLKKLWGEGKTAAEIAKVLGDGVTRNAVIGKAHRLKLSTRLSPIQQNTRPVNKAEAPKIRKAAPRVDFKGNCVKMVDLTPQMCRWPNGDPQEETFSFCGCQIVEGLPYCPEHARAAYQIVSKSRHYKAEDFPDDAGTPTDFEIKAAANG